MNVHWTCRIERCDAILRVWDLFGLTPKSRPDLYEKAAEFVNKDMTIFMRSEKTTGYPLMNNIAWCMWMKVSSLLQRVAHITAHRLPLFTSDQLPESRTALLHVYGQ
jgi:hypothetical protein